MVIQDVDSTLISFPSDGVVSANFTIEKEALWESCSISNSDSNNEASDEREYTTPSLSTFLCSSRETLVDEDDDDTYFAQFEVPNDRDDVSDNDFNDEVYLEKHLCKKQLTLADKYEQENYQRSKRSNKKMHAQRQIKTKYATSIKYNSHNVKLYIHHRLVKRVQLDPPIYHTPALNQSTNSYSCKELKSPIKEKQSRSSPPPPITTTDINSNTENNKQNSQFQEYVINETNMHVDPTFDDVMISFLLDMQNRDLSPEDYEMLLRLDERVQRKTVDTNILDSLPTVNVDETHLNEQCAICIETYSIGQQLKLLPCNHIFHLHCIETYLKEFSVQCPLDNLPLL